MRALAGMTLLIIALLPVFLKGYFLYLATEAVIWALAATGFVLLFRATGLVSLGHAAFFGGGAYLAALIARPDPSGYLIVFPAALAYGFGLAAFIGLLALRSHGIFFLMLTLSFSELVYILVKQGFPQFTGGDDGLSGVPRPPGLEDPALLYLFALGLLLLILLLYGALARSPLGQILDALRLNERRLSVLGYDTRLYKLLAFGLSGALAALAGVLLAAHRGFVHPHDLAWNISGELMVMGVVGGITRVSGGVVGALVLVLLENLLSSYSAQLWNLFLGLFLMGAALFNAGGFRLMRGKAHGARG